MLYLTLNFSKTINIGWFQSRETERGFEQIKHIKVASRHKALGGGIENKPQIALKM